MIEPTPATRPSLDLATPRDLGQILSACLSLYMRYFGLFASLALGIVVPIDFAILGLGEGLLWSGYDNDPPIVISILDLLVPLLVVTPLVTGTHVHAVRAIGAGRAPTASEAFDAGLRVLAPAAAVVALYSLGVGAGLIALLIPGIYLGVRWCVAVPAAVVEGVRGARALRRSADLVEGSWWRVFGVLIVLFLIAATVGAALGVPLDLFADDLDSGPAQLIGRMLSDTVIYSFTALSSTLLYFDLRARQEDPPIRGGAQ